MGQKKTTIQTGTWSPSWGYSLQASASMAQYPTNPNRSAGTEYPNGRSSATPTERFVRTATNVTAIAAYVATYPNNTAKAGWVNGVSPKNK